MTLTEADFEASIVRPLVEDGGYVEGDPSTFNADLGLFERDLATTLLGPASSTPLL